MSVVGEQLNKKHVIMELSIFEKSKTFVNNENLEIFTSPETDSSYILGNYQKINSSNYTKGTESNILFEIKQNQDFLDLSDSFVHVSGRFLKSDGTFLDAADKIAPANLFFHTFFEDVAVTLNNCRVTSNNCNYPYQAWILAQLQNGLGAKKSMLSKEIYYPEPSDELDTFEKTNTSFQIRSNIVRGSRPFEMIGRPLQGIFQNQKFFPPGTSITVDMKRSKPDFCLSGPLPKGGNRKTRQAEALVSPQATKCQKLDNDKSKKTLEITPAEALVSPQATKRQKLDNDESENTLETTTADPTDSDPDTESENMQMDEAATGVQENKPYKIQIEDAVLYVRRIIVNPKKQAEIRQSFSKKKATYSFDDIKISAEGFMLGEKNYRIRSLNTGNDLPKLIVVGIVATEAYYGKIDKTPFNFKPYDLESLKLNLNDQAIVFDEMNFKDENYMLGYNTLCKLLSERNCDNGIYYPDYAYGNALFVFDTQNLNTTDFNSTRVGNLGLEFTFANLTTQNLTAIVMTISDVKIEIDGKGNTEFVRRKEIYV